MKTASVQQLPEQWPEILRWVAAGEEVQVTQQDKVVARVVPAGPSATPDFLARAKAVWGEVPAGMPLSEVVSDSRGASRDLVLAANEFLSTDSRQRKLAVAMGLNVLS